MDASGLIHRVVRESSFLKPGRILAVDDSGWCWVETTDSYHLSYWDLSKVIIEPLDSPQLPEHHIRIEIPPLADNESLLDRTTREVDEQQ